MTHTDKKYFQIFNLLVVLVLTLSMTMPSSVVAAPVTTPLDLATIPLANSPTVTIQPNLLFVLDDSGSMGRNYMPDGFNSSNASLFRDASYNTLAYNPAIRYEPPANFDAGGLNLTKYPSQIGANTATGASSSTKPNWRAVKNDAYRGTSTSNLEGDASFYIVIPGEYCARRDLKVCNAQTAPSTAFPYPAPVRWCDTSTNANAAVPAAGSCQATKLTGFTNLRTPGIPAYRSTINITSASSTPRVTGITIAGQQIMDNRTNSSNTTSTLAGWVATEINNCTSSTTGNCTVSGYSATSSGSVVTITAPASVTSPPPTPVLSSSSGTLNYTASAFVVSAGTVPGSKVFTNIVSTNNSYPYPGSATKASSRIDCAGATCTYVEEMTNYANWWTYYQTRMQMMKTSASLAFKDLGDDFRVGFMTIHPNSSNSLNFDTFNTPQKALWYSKLFSIDDGSATPLRYALAVAGRIYAKKETVSSVFTDPMEYSCQQNFTLLTTDGFWNTDPSVASGVDGVAIGNLDGGTTLRPKYEGAPPAFTSTGSLADVAKYYADTDIRSATFGNCTGALGDNVCEDPAPATTNQKQNMVTFTLGLGVDGTLAFESDYKSATTGDFQDIKDGLKNWPKPVADSPQAIDDLWHAAVNGDGTYFSAKNPTDLVNSLKEALASIKVKRGAASAAATSTQTPEPGNNSAYVASYTSGEWTGNLEKRLINISTGNVELTAIACVEDVVTSTSCLSPSSVVADGSGGYDCVTPNTDPSICGGNDCKVPLPVSCNGTLKNKRTAVADTRTIKMNNGGVLTDFTYANIASAGLGATFDPTFLAANLTQWLTLTPAQRANVTPVNLVNYLRGQTGFDEGAANPDQRVFRKRQAVLGDTVNSKPNFVGAPKASYNDPGYAAFKAAQASRPGVVYVAGNDGMLHAFDAGTLEELWAYVPTPVIANMWKLADAAYASKHSYYADGSPIVNQVCVSACGSASAVWKTMLVAGLNGGGRGYYALDVTDPINPVLMWEFTANNEPNLGYTYGKPVITKLPDATGTWVVLVTSGYNNIPDNSAFYALTTTKFKPNNPAQYTTGNGQGYLYILDAASGIKINQIATGVGSPSTPSGLANIRAHIEDNRRNNTATYVYGGDLLGNLWRFNLSDNSKILFATLQASGNQSVTVAPSLGLINKKRVVFIGTGKYLEVSDLTDTSQQTFYGIKDDEAGITLVNPRASLVEQTIVPFGADSRKSGVNNAVDFNTGRGWYVDLPDNGERQNIEAQLERGTLIVPTVVPTSSACQPAGYGWFNYFDYKTGSAVNLSDAIVSARIGSPIVGFNVMYINGKPVIYYRQADGGEGSITPPDNPDGIGFNEKRSIWRELID